MRKALFVLCMVSSSLGFGFVDLPNQRSSRPAPIKITCADFSGTWKGICMDSGSSQKMSVEWQFIQKECETLDTGSTLISLGGQITATYGEEAGKLSTYAVTSVWNKTKTELSVTTVATGPNGFEPGSTTSGIIKLKDSHTLVLVAQRLDSSSPTTCEVTK